jgi:hypothetical protein
MVLAFGGSVHAVDSRWKDVVSKTDRVLRSWCAKSVVEVYGKCFLDLGQRTFVRCRKSMLKKNCVAAAKVEAGLGLRLKLKLRRDPS